MSRSRDLPDPTQTAVDASFAHRPVYLVKRISLSNRSRIEAALKPLGLTVPQYACLYVLHEEPGLSGAQIARRAFVSRQLVHRELQKLNTLGWITQAPSPKDGRIEIAHLTDAGRERIESAIAPLIELEQETLSVFSDEEREQLTELLIRWDEQIRRTDD